MPRRRNGHSTPFGSHGTTTPGNGSQSRRAARRRRTGVSTRSGPCCVPTSRSSWWMGRSCSTTKGEEERYLKSLLTNFSQGLLRLKEDLLAGEGGLVEFPRIWIIALSKADLFPDWDVHSFRDLVIWNAAEHIERLRETLREFVVTPEVLSMGEDFMLLSSAKFELSSADAEPVRIDVTKRVGVNLILPVASLLPLEHLVQWQEKIQIPMQVL